MRRRRSPLSRRRAPTPTRSAAAQSTRAAALRARPSWVPARGSSVDGARRLVPGVAGHAYAVVMRRAARGSGERLDGGGGRAPSVELAEGREDAARTPTPWRQAGARPAARARATRRRPRSTARELGSLAEPAARLSDGSACGRRARRRGGGHSTFCVRWCTSTRRARRAGRTRVRSARCRPRDSSASGCCGRQQRRRVGGCADGRRGARAARRRPRHRLRRVGVRRWRAAAPLRREVSTRVRAARQVTLRLELPMSDDPYTVVGSTFGAGELASFMVYVYADQPVEVLGAGGAALADDGWVTDDGDANGAAEGQLIAAGSALEGPPPPRRQARADGGRRRARRLPTRGRRSSRGCRRRRPARLRCRRSSRSSRAPSQPPPRQFGVAQGLAARRPPRDTGTPRDGSTDDGGESEYSRRRSSVPGLVDPRRSIDEEDRMGAASCGGELD